jgi:histone acetyltransferase SAS3
MQLSYCNQDEENDPSPDYEAYLSCVVCGDNGMYSHQNV